MQIMIDTRQCPCRELNDECGISGMECYEDDTCSTCPLIRNGGIKLPEGHGRLIDADELYDSLEFPTQQFALAFKQVLDDAPTIIEADRGRK